MADGTVKFFNESCGSGLITPDAGGRDIHVHVSDLERAGIERLRYGQRVSFEVGLDRHGRAAVQTLCLIPNDADRMAPLPYRRAGAR